MAFFLTELLRRVELKKHSSAVATGFIPLKDIRTALVILDGTDPRCLASRDAMEAFLRGYKIDPSFIFIDLRKRKKGVTVYASGDGLISRRYVNFFGMPRMKKKGHLFSSDFDLLINLRDSDDYTGNFISAAARARFKIGTRAYPGNPFDLTVTAGDYDMPGEDAPDDGLVHENHIDEKIEAICNFLKQIV